jgi:hypothetical protein
MLPRVVLLALLIATMTFCAAAGGLVCLVIAFSSFVLAYSSSAVSLKKHLLFSPLLAIGVGAITGTLTAEFFRPIAPLPPMGAIIGMIFGMWSWVWSTIGWLPVRHVRLADTTIIPQSTYLRVGSLLRTSLAIFLASPMISMVLFVMWSRFSDDGKMECLKEPDWMFYRNGFLTMGTIVGALVAAPYFVLGLYQLAGKKRDKRDKRGQ